MLSKDVTVVNVLYDSSCFGFKVLSLLSFELYKGCKHLITKFFGSSSLDNFVMLLTHPLASFQMDHCETQFVLRFHKRVSPFHVFAPLIKLCAGLLQACINDEFGFSMHHDFCSAQCIVNVLVRIGCKWLKNSVYDFFD